MKTRNVVVSLAVLGAALFGLAALSGTGPRTAPATGDATATPASIEPSAPPPPVQQVNVVNFPKPQIVAGTVSVGNLPAVQAVTGSVSVGNLPTDTDGNLRVQVVNAAPKTKVIDTGEITVYPQTVLTFDVDGYSKFSVQYECFSTYPDNGSNFTIGWRNASDLPFRPTYPPVFQDPWYVRDGDIHGKELGLSFNGGFADGYIVRLVLYLR